MLITSLDNDRIKNYIKLKDRKYRKKEKKFIIEGMHMVLEAIKCDIVEELIVEKDIDFTTDLPTIYVTTEIIKKISDLETPSNIMAICKMTENNLIGNRILLLDDIQDPGNLGTIIRSAKAFNVDTIVISSNTVDIYNSKVLRSTQGMIFHINIVVRDLHDVILSLKEEGIPIYGTKVDSGEDVRLLKEDERKKYALIMGNEGSGVSKELLDMCDKYFYIDMNHEVESLNVGVATSILLYELNK